MSIVSSIRSFFRPRIDRGVVVYSQPAARAWVDGLSVEELYETQPQLRTVVSFIASNIAQLPLKCYTRESDISRTRDTTGVAPLLLRYPNCDMTTYELIYTLVSDLKLYDFAVWMVVEDADSPSGWTIRPIPPAWFEGFKGGNLFSADVVVVRNPETGETFDLRRDECIVWHGWQPGSPREGLSPVSALKSLLKDQIEMMSYRSQLWDRASRVPAYIYRPVTAESWDDESMDRFSESWRESWTRNGSRAGGTPVLEDGMELRKAPGVDAEHEMYSAIFQLSFRSTCALYRIRPGLIDDDGQTYASVRENARSLYAECLGPDLRMISERLNSFLLPMIGAPADEYVEFDLDEKLNGSFLERADVLQTSVGGPWMTRAEARAASNLPPIEGADGLIVPLNVAIGGLASPRATTYASGQVEEKAAESDAPEAVVVDQMPAGSSTVYHLEVKDEDRERLERVLARFFARQERSVLPAIGAEKAKGTLVKATTPADTVVSWWDSKRWDLELSDDLTDALTKLVSTYGQLAVDAVSEAGGAAFDASATSGYIRAVAEAKAKGINQSTLLQLLRSLGEEYSIDADKSTPAGVFREARDRRAKLLADSISKDMSAWATQDGFKQAGRDRGIMKVWRVNSSNPRDSHISMNGQTVPLSARFSNGARWPGDTGALSVDDIAGCQCSMDFIIANV